MGRQREIAEECSESCGGGKRGAAWQWSCSKETHIMAPTFGCATRRLRQKRFRRRVGGDRKKENGKRQNKTIPNRQIPLASSPSLVFSPSLTRSRHSPPPTTASRLPQRSSSSPSGKAPPSLTKLSSVQRLPVAFGARRRHSPFAVARCQFCGCGY